MGTYLFTHSFYKHMSEYLLCAGHSSKSQEWASEQDRHGLCRPGADVLIGQTDAHWWENGRLVLGTPDGWQVGM